MNETDKNRNVDSEAVRWLEQARQDYKSAEVLRDGERYYMVCFISQQIAEKALKAYLYSRGHDLVFGHSVAKLCDSCVPYDQKYSELKSEIKNLDQYYIEARYPNGLPESVPAEFFDETDARHALAMAKQALDTVETDVRRPPDESRS